MTKDLKLVNMTTQDFASAKDVELFENRWGKMGKVYYPLLRKGGMIKHSVLKVWNKLSEHRFIHIFEYQIDAEDIHDFWHYFMYIVRYF